TWRSSARPPPRSTAPSRWIRHVMLAGVKRPRERSPARRPYARRRRATSAGASPGVARRRVTRRGLYPACGARAQGRAANSPIFLDPSPTPLYGSRMKRGLPRASVAFRALACLMVFGVCGSVLAAPRPSLSPRIVEATTIRRALRTRHHRIVVSLDLRNRDALETFLVALQDPASPQYQHFLTQDEFNALYAPTLAEEEAVVRHLRRHGFRVTERYPNRLLVGAVGDVAAIETAFGVEMQDVTVRHQRHFTANREPSFPPDIAHAIVGVIGLDDLVSMRSHVRVPQQAVAPGALIGARCCHLSPNDLFTFYDNTAVLNGAGETIVIAGAFAWRDTDNTAFNSQWGLPQLPAGSGQVCTGAVGSLGCRFDLQNSIEIALDAEYAHGTAPQARILNYMSASTSLADFTRMYNRIVIDNPGHVVSTSWGACEAAVSAATQQTDDNIVANANAIGQSWLPAPGDHATRHCNAPATVVN